LIRTKVQPQPFTKGIEEMRILVVSLALFVMASAASATDETEVRQVITKRIENLWEDGVLGIGDTEVMAVRLVPEVYLMNDFRPVWSSKDRVEDLPGKDELLTGKIAIFQVDIRFP